MRRYEAILIASVLILLLPMSAALSVELKRSVIGCAGGRCAGSGCSSLSTLGQPAIGRYGPGTNYLGKIGFLYNYLGILTAVGDGTTPLPQVFALSQNYPNPFNPVTTIRYAVPKQSRVHIRLYDVSGRLVRTLLDETLAPGHYETVFNAKSLPSGIFFYKMEAEDFEETKRLVLLK
jgi:hypothetical protein